LRAGGAKDNGCEEIRREQSRQPRPADAVWSGPRTDGLQIAV